MDHGEFEEVDIDQSINLHSEVPSSHIVTTKSTSDYQELKHGTNSTYHDSLLHEVKIKASKLFKKYIMKGSELRLIYHGN